MKKLKNELKEWWYSITILLAFGFSISLHNFSIFFNILNSTISIHSWLPKIFNIYKWKNLFFKMFSINKYKFIEISLSYLPSLETKVIFISEIHSNHSMTEIELAILGLEFTFGIHDKRHWNSSENKWEEIC